MTEPPSGGNVQRFFGLIIIAASILWMALCGLCGIGMIYTLIQGGEWNEGGLMGLVLVLALSGGGMAAGYALLTVGRGLAK